MPLPHTLLSHLAVPALLAILLATAALAGEPRAPKGVDLPDQKKPPSNQWLQDADSDGDRFRKLETYLGGFSSAMQEVGKRYRHFHQAIADDNFALARYHWEKIRDAINTGLMKRPARTANAEAVFLDNAWPAMHDALAGENGEQIRRQFMGARDACKACHVAENVPFMNDQPLFRELTFD